MFLKLDKRRLEASDKKAETFEEENSFLMEHLVKYENPKNRRKSYIPPSKDENRP
ncbi:MAG TPA: hypothetical protein VFD29_07870 [Gillisia sp.]|nr:hypothetical protein [Gillisia sp.]